jgi:hypothetical protein
MEELIIFIILSLLFLALFIIEMLSKKEKRQLPKLWLSVFVLMVVITMSYITNHPEAVEEITAMLNF